MLLVQKTVYIREEDIEAWKKVPNKAEFIHMSLNQPKFHPLTKDDKAVLSRPMVVEGFPEREKTSICKHNNPKGSCMHKESHRLKCNV